MRGDTAADGQLGREVGDGGGQIEENRHKQCKLKHIKFVMPLS